MTRFHVDESALYWTDNGRLLCGACLGYSARTTGHDISGQRIARVTEEDARAFEADLADLSTKCACERCGKGFEPPSRIIIAQRIR